MAQQKILIVDDDTNISELISLYLKKEFFETRHCEDGESVLSMFASWKPDLILLDLMLPKLDGYQVCRELRKTSQVPIIMMSAKGEVFDKVLGLELGADDYVIKPFDMKELVARIKAVLRRTPSVPVRAEEDETVGIVRLPDLIIDKNNYTVTLYDEPLSLPPKELELLFFLASSPNRVFTRDQLLNQVWGYDFAGDSRTVDVHIKRLREKLGDHAVWALNTVWGVGYRFEVRQ